MSRRARLIQLALTAALAVAMGGCGGSSSASGHLQTAISYLPSQAGASYEFTFADWSKVERQLGVKPGQLTTARALETLYRPTHDLGELPAGIADYDLGTPGPHRLWAASDVTWDATEAPLGKSAPPLHLTGLQPQFDLASIGKHLAGCGFTSEKVRGISLYTASLDKVLNCAGPFGNQIPTYTNYGPDAAHHTVLMSNSPDTIAAALSANHADKASSELNQVLGQLSGQPAIALGVGPAFCALASHPASFDHRLTPRLVPLLNKAYSPATPYLAFAYGLSLTPQAETGRIVFAYSDANTAKAELSDREHRLQNGKSFLVQQPYSKLVHVVSGHTSGSNVVLEVDQPSARPLQLTNMFNQLDIGFARCG